MVWNWQSQCSIQMLYSWFWTLNIAKFNIYNKTLNFVDIFKKKIIRIRLVCKIYLMIHILIFHTIIALLVIRLVGLYSLLLYRWKLTKIPKYTKGGKKSFSLESHFKEYKLHYNLQNYHFVALYFFYFFSKSQLAYFAEMFAFLTYNFAFRPIITKMIFLKFAFLYLEL